MELGKNFAENVRRVDDCLRVRENFDLIKKELTVGGRETVFYYPDGMVDADVMEKLMIYLLSLKPDIWSGCAGDAQGFTEGFARTHLPFIETDVTRDTARMLRSVLSGAVLMLADGFGAYAVVIDARTYPMRSVEEPETDRVILGARDGFTETLVLNTALIRRRVRNPALTMRYVCVGSISQTDVAICYLDGRADADYVRRLEKRLSSLPAKSLTMGHESLAELLIPSRWYNPFPKIRYTERPDTAAAQLMEGNVLLLCDNSPVVMILPTSLFDFLQETNDFYLPPLTGTYIRLLRHVIFWATLFLTPLWLLFVRNPDLTPTFLRFCLPAETGKIPIVWQLLLVELIVDGLRMASMNTPDMLSNSLSVVGGLILGDFAVEIGWLIPEVIVFMAFVAISNFTQRSYQLGYAFKFLRIALLLLVRFFDGIGLLLGCVGILLLLLTNRTVDGKRSYLYPLLPFNGKALLSLFVRLKKTTTPKPSVWEKG